jgi:hypothetical protein
MHIQFTIHNNLLNFLSIFILSLLLVFLEQTFEHPVFLVQEDDTELYKLFVNGALVCTSECLEKCFSLVFACFYIFDLAISKHLKRTLFFFQKFAFKIDDNGSEPYMKGAKQRCFALIEKLTMKGRKIVKCRSNDEAVSGVDKQMTMSSSNEENIGTKDSSNNRDLNHGRRVLKDNIDVTPRSTVCERQSDTINLCVGQRDDNGTQNHGRKRKLAADRTVAKKGKVSFTEDLEFF